MSTRIWIALGLLSLAAFPRPALGSVAGSLKVGFLPDANFTFGPDSPPESLEYQQTFTSGVPPVVTYARSAEGSIDGEHGWLSAYASAELNGIPPTAPPDFYGISSEAEVYAIDRFNVESEVLEEGTEVELAFAMDVQGNGRAEARMHVDRQEGSTLFSELNLSYSASGGGSVSDFSEGSITARVGKRYRIEYSLGISLDLTPTGLSEENPTKFVVSDYQSRFYVTPITQLVVTLVSASGHDYMAVPEPAAVPAALTALAVLALRVRRTGRGHEAPPRSVR